MRKFYWLFLLLIGCAPPRQTKLTVDPISEPQFSGEWRCETSAVLRVPFAVMRHWGHTQGIAVAAEYIIISAQVKGMGAILLKFRQPSGELWQHRWLGNATRDHPSDLQICENTLAVAVAVPQRDSFSRIHFCNATTLQCVGDSIEFNDHIGALAFGRYQDMYYLIGGTWDSDRLVLFRSQQRTHGYEPVGVWNWRDRQHPESVDSLKYKYNALHFYPQKKGFPLLYASSGNVLDIWELLGLAEGDLKLKKIGSKKTDGCLLTGNGRLFHEGMDVQQIEKQISYYAAPHDFNPDSTHANFFLAPHYLRCLPRVD